LFEVITKATKKQILLNEFAKFRFAHRIVGPFKFVDGSHFLSRTYNVRLIG